MILGFLFVILVIFIGVANEYGLNANWFVYALLGSAFGLLFGSFILALL